jgi:transposase
MSRDPSKDVEDVSMTRSAAAPKKRRVGRSSPYRWRVSDELWAKLEPMLADPPRRFRYPGRARYAPRACLEGILYVLFTDTPWLELPYRELGLPSGETCRRRLEEWSRRGLFERALVLLQDELAGAQRLDWSRVIVDASLVEAKKGASRSRARSWAGREAATTSR